MKLKLRKKTTQRTINNKENQDIDFKNFIGVVNETLRLHKQIIKKINQADLQLKKNLHSIKIKFAKKLYKRIGSKNNTKTSEKKIKKRKILKVNLLEEENRKDSEKRRKVLKKQREVKSKI